MKTRSSGRPFLTECTDDRFVIKEMMNAWNVAEKDAFLKFAPKYFEHINKSANVSMTNSTKRHANQLAQEPSVLAKIFGFFTIRMKNAADKKSILNLDVLVMEHLFFSQNVIKVSICLFFFFFSGTTAYTLRFLPEI